MATAHPRMQPGPGVAPEECKVAPRLKLEVTKGQNQVRAERGLVGPSLEAVHMERSRIVKRPSER